MNNSYKVYFIEHNPVVYFIDAPDPKEAALAARDMYREGKERVGTFFIEGLADDEATPENTVFEVYDRKSEKTMIFSEEAL